MIQLCITHLKTVLTKIGIEKIYDKESDASAFKGSDYALISTVEKESIEYDGSKVNYFDDFDRAVRTYHIRRYKVSLTLTVRFVSKEDAMVMKLKDAFLASLGSSFADPEGYRFDVKAVAVRWIKDKALMSSGAGYEVDVKFDGGVYVKKEVKLLTELTIEGNFMKGGKDNGGNDEERSG